MSGKMPDFLTDEEMAQLEAKEKKSPDFISDEEMAKLEAAEKEKQEPSMLAQLGKATTEQLPILGATLGGGLGLVSPVPGGAIGGSAIGGYAGKALQNLIEGQVNEKPISTKELLLSPIEEAASAASSELVGGKLAPMALEAGGKAIKSMSSSLSKIPEKVMETYYKHAPEIDAIPDLSEAAEAIRAKANKAIESFKGLQNAKITRAIESKAGDLMDLKPAISVIEENISKLDPIVDAQKVQKLQSQIDLMKHLSDAEGNVTAKQGYALMKDLQEKAEYIPAGQSFKRKDFSDLTFQRAASYARRELNRVAPEIGQANAQLGKLRRMEKTFPRNLLKPEAPIASIMGAGTGENLTNVQQVRKLEGVLGQSLLPDMEKLASAKYFQEAGLLPGEKTGSSLAPLILSGVGGGAGALSGDKDLALSGLALGAMASPVGIKYGIKAARTAAEMAPLASMDAARMMMSRAIQAGIHPSNVDKQLQKTNELTPTQKAQLRNENAQGAQ